MKRRLYIECGAAETRAALFRGDTVVRFWFGPARGDEGLPRPAQKGDIFRGRVRNVSKALHAAFVDVGEAAPGFLQLKKNQKAPVEGAAIVVEVKRPAIGRKGPLLTCSDAALEGRVDAPARLSAGEDAAIAAFRRLKACGVDEVLIDDPQALALLRAVSDGEAGLLRESFATLGVDEAIERALMREVALPGGARLVFDETEAMTVVDVDSGAAGEGRSSSANDKVNLAAANALFLELARRGAGGRILVDFLPPSNAKARAALLETLKERSRDVFSARIGKLSVDGIFDCAAPRDDHTLLERASEPAAGAEWLRAGRCFSLDWQAKAAIRVLEAALRAAPSARLRLLAGNAVAAYFSRRPQWRERLAARFGARFEIGADESLEERAFHVVEKR